MPNFMTDEEREAENEESRPDGRGDPHPPRPPQRPMTPEESREFFPEGGLGRDLADAGLVAVDDKWPLPGYVKTGEGTDDGRRVTFYRRLVDGAGRPLADEPQRRAYAPDGSLSDMPVGEVGVERLRPARKAAGLEERGTTTGRTQTATENPSAPPRARVTGAVHREYHEQVVERERAKAYAEGFEAGEQAQPEKNVMVLTGEFIAWRAALDGWGSQSLEVGNENVVLKFFRDGTHVRLVFTAVIDRFGGVAAALSFNGEAGELLCLSMLGVDMALNALRTPVEAR